MFVTCFGSGPNTGPKVICLSCSTSICIYIIFICLYIPGLGALSIPHSLKVLDTWSWTHDQGYWEFHFQLRFTRLNMDAHRRQMKMLEQQAQWDLTASSMHWKRDVHAFQSNSPDASNDRYVVLWAHYLDIVDNNSYASTCTCAHAELHFQHCHHLWGMT